MRLFLKAVPLPSTVTIVTQRAQSCWGHLDGTFHFGSGPHTANKNSSFSETEPFAGSQRVDVVGGGQRGSRGPGVLYLGLSWLLCLSLICTTWSISLTW